MRDQNNKVHRPNDPLPKKPRIAVIVMISEIRNQETARRYQSPHLTISMAINHAGSNKPVTGYQQQRARSV